MKIKKPMSVKAPRAENTGGATIADRFKLENVEASVKHGGTVGKKSAMTALIFGLIAFAVTATLTVTLYMHLDYLSRA